MNNLITQYMGQLSTSPLVASEALLRESVEKIARLGTRGTAAVVYPSLSEEQLGPETQGDR